MSPRPPEDLRRIDVLYILDRIWGTRRVDESRKLRDVDHVKATGTVAAKTNAVEVKQWVTGVGKTAFIQRQQVVLLLLPHHNDWRFSQSVSITT